ncbi:hypothetical protein CBL_10154 [Carabus blaptoides fortunei]
MSAESTSIMDQYFGLGRRSRNQRTVVRIIVPPCKPGYVLIKNKCRVSFSNRRTANPSH